MCIIGILVERKTACLRPTFLLYLRLDDFGDGDDDDDNCEKSSNNNQVRVYYIFVQWVGFCPKKYLLVFTALLFVSAPAFFIFTV